MDALLARLQRNGAVKDDDTATLKRLPHRVLTVQAGEEVLAAGAELTQVFVVEGGWGIRSRTLTDGRRQIVNFMIPGDCFDLQAMASARSDHAVSSLTPMRLRVVPSGAFAETIQRSAGLAASFWWVALQEESILREHIVRLGKRGARERLAHLLLELRRRRIAVGADEDTASQSPLTREVLADALGLSVVHVSRVVGQLSKAGLLTVRHRLLLVRDYLALAQFCGFDAQYLHLGSAPLAREEAVEGVQGWG